MRRQLLPALRMLVVLTVVLGLAYPLAVLAVSQVAFHDKANGSLVKEDGQVVGSSLLGQTFTGDQYFQGRPSAAGITASGTNDADGQPGDPSDLSLSNSGGSNLGPTNPKLLDGATDDPSTPDVDESADGVAQRVEAYRELNGLAADADGAGRRGDVVGVGRRPADLGGQRPPPGEPGGHRPRPRRGRPSTS